MTTFNNPYIRDELTIDGRVQQFYDSCQGDGPVLLLGRIVTHASTLRVHRQPLIIVADVYVGTNGGIDAIGFNSGAVGGYGGTGGSPWPPYHPFTEMPTGSGGGGGLGGTGGPGTNAVAVTVYCRRSINASVSAVGGTGAPGGLGGYGGRGVDGFVTPDQVIWVDDTPDNLSNFAGHEEVIPGRSVDGTPGGDGGMGGTGGAGGNGGLVMFTSIVDDTPPVLDVRAGTGGSGGPGGAPGIDGAFSASTAIEGPSGTEGSSGAEGMAIATNITEPEFVAGLRSVLDMPGISYANYWAPYRIWVADYFYHRHNPSVPGREHFSQLTAIELTRALELQPDNAEALRLQAQLVGVRQASGVDDFIWVGGGHNALGLPRDLDVQPNVDAYLDGFVQFLGLSLQFLTQGLGALLASVTLERLRGIADLQRLQAENARDALAADLGIALAEKQLAGEEAAHVRQMLDQATAEIQAALEEMKASELTFGDIVGTVAAVGAAVVSVVAAIPTAGASLVALVPAMVALTSTVIANAEPIAKAVFESTEPDVKAVEEAYKKVDKRLETVLKAGKSIVNFVEIVKKLSAGTTPDNAKHLNLVRRGVDLTHQVLLARNKATLAQQRVEAAQAKLARATSTAIEAERLVTEIQLDATSVRRTALTAVAVVQSKADALLGMAFRAQRSVEIYTLQRVEQHLLLDAGLLHPDDVRSYEEGQIDEPALHAKLQQSWLQMLEPTGIKQQYLSFFDQPHDHDRLRLSFTADRPQFAQLLQTRRFGFRVEATDIPADRGDAKIVGVRIAFVGAIHPANEVSCDVRHGPAYGQRRKDGTVMVQQLTSLVNNRFAKLQSLGGNEGSIVDPEPPAVGSLAFWGRGIGGDWTVSVPGRQLNADLDLSGLTEIQVWIGYRFVR